MWHIAYFKNLQIRDFAQRNEHSFFDTYLLFPHKIKRKI